MGRAGGRVALTLTSNPMKAFFCATNCGQGTNRFGNTTCRFAGTVTVKPFTLIVPPELYDSSSTVALRF